MGKANKFEDDSEIEFEFNPIAAASKLPADISDGKKPINEYMSIPINRIIPFRQKENSDFHHYSQEQFEMMVKSIAEVGVLEAITVRALTDGKYELLAGEHRWLASRDAGLKQIPAHILTNLNDHQAMEYFTITNLLRRENSISDKVNGWWLYYQNSLKRGSKDKLVDKDMLDKVKTNESVSDETISERQIRRYAKMHDLIPVFLERLDSQDNPLSRQAGYHLSYLDTASQAIVASMNCAISMDQAEVLHTLFNDDVLDASKIKEILGGSKLKQEKRNVTFAPLVRNIKRLTIARLDSQYYDIASEIFAQALEQYLTEHPEYKKD